VARVHRKERRVVHQAVSVALGPKRPGRDRANDGPTHGKRHASRIPVTGTARHARGASGSRSAAAPNTSRSSPAQPAGSAPMSPSDRPATTSHRPCLTSLLRCGPLAFGPAEGAGIRTRSWCRSSAMNGGTEAHVPPSLVPEAAIRRYDAGARACSDLPGQYLPSPGRGVTR
jgi:hypothetical protein